MIKGPKDEYRAKAIIGLNCVSKIFQKSKFGTFELLTKTKMEIFRWQEEDQTPPKEIGFTF
jgi:hypothetical protein